MAAPDQDSGSVHGSKEVAMALHSIATSNWAKQEQCYLTLLKLLDNILAHPGEAKFRLLKTSNVTLRSKVFDIPGACDFLLAIGFVEEEGGEFLTLPVGEDGGLAAARETLQQHANGSRLHEMRRQRDARIVAAKAEEAKADRFKVKAHLTEEEKEELHRKIERDRAEIAAERELNPTRDSKAHDMKFGATQGDTSFLKNQGGG
uniref:PUB domain-containing protein n=1 Tax=Pyrodinium bahamense TaxID=73915 RepID=A0A7S0FTW8_9DINO